MIEELLPAHVACAEAYDDPPGLQLFPEEQADLARAVEKRRREYTTVRHCARQALAELGIAPVAIVRGGRGAPQWPSGIVGSMTHTAGYRAAAVARASELTSVGIDAEPHGPLPGRVLETIALPGERDRLAKLAAADPSVHWDRLLFCAKEAVYKTWFPLTRSWLGFEDADITIDAVTRTFAARLLVPGPLVGGTRLGGFEGRWAAGGGLVLAAIALPLPGTAAEGGMRA